MAERTTSPDVQFITLTAKGVQLWCQQSPSKSVQNKWSLLGADASSPITDCFLSDDGTCLAVTLRQSVLIYRQERPDEGFSKLHLELPIAEAKSINFSPKSTFVAVGTALTSMESKNLRLYEVSTGKLLYELNDTKRDLIKWTSDESLAYRMVGSELYFYENNDFSKPAKKIAQKIASYSLAFNKLTGRIHVAIMVKGVKSTPSSVKVYSYPHVDNVVAQQSLFKSDSVDVKWNSKGDAMVLLATQDIDTTGQSYYGQTFAHFLDLKGNACLVGGKKAGSVHSCEWLPNNEGFIAIYGKTPAAITLYNPKGDAIYQFGEAPVNTVLLNPFGNLVAFGGFGNLAGDVHVWNLKSRTKISHFQVSDTTQFDWTADGLHMITSTHYARLKVANGFKVWDYLGNHLHTEGCRDDLNLPLYRVLPVASSAFPAPEVAATVKGKIMTEKPVYKYVPPSQRTEKQRREAAKKQAALKSRLQGGPAAAAAGDVSGKEKKVQALEKKLQQIEKLKQSQAEGKQLEKNQLDKLEKEQEVIEELKALKLEG